MINYNNQIFKKDVSDFLENSLSIDVEKFESTLIDRFGAKAKYFDDIIKFLINDKSSDKLKGLVSVEFNIENEGFKNRFLNHVNSIDSDEGILDFSFVMFAYFSAFYQGGLAEVFKRRQAEDSGPQIELKERIISDSELNKLPTEIIAYRGMSWNEFNGRKFGMSWSRNEQRAINFAFDFYNKKGVVVKSNIPRDLIYHFYVYDAEEELIIPNNSILKVELLHKQKP